MGIVGLLTDDDAVLDEDLVHALAAAVMPASGRNPLAARVMVYDRGMLGFGKRGLVDAKTHAKRSNGSGSRGAALQELPAIDLRIEQFVHQLRHS